MGDEWACSKKHVGGKEKKIILKCSYIKKAVFKQRQQAAAWRMAAVVCLFGGNEENGFTDFREVPRIWVGTMPIKTSFWILLFERNYIQHSANVYITFQ